MMNDFPSFLTFSAICVAHASAQQSPALLNEPPDGTEAPAPEVRAVFRPAEVLGTTVHRQGGRDIIVEHLALDPADPVRPVVPVRPAAVTTAPQPQETQLPAAPFRLNMLSATVYPGPRTRVEWTSLSGGGGETHSGWSNVDFNHFAGITTFLGTDGENHSFSWSISTATEPPPDAPVFESEAPIFIPDRRDVPADAMVFIDSLHKLYAIEHEKLAAAHAGRARAEAARKAELIANPPRPKDLVIRYRIAETPLTTQPEGGAK